MSGQQVARVLHVATALPCTLGQIACRGQGAHQPAEPKPLQTEGCPCHTRRGGHPSEGAFPRLAWRHRGPKLAFPKRFAHHVRPCVVGPNHPQKTQDWPRVVRCGLPHPHQCCKGRHWEEKKQGLGPRRWRPLGRLEPFGPCQNGHDCPQQGVAPCRPRHGPHHHRHKHHTCEGACGRLIPLRGCHPSSWLSQASAAEACASGTQISTGRTAKHMPT